MIIWHTRRLHHYGGLVSTIITYSAKVFEVIAPRIFSKRYRTRRLK